MALTSWLAVCLSPSTAGRGKEKRRTSMAMGSLLRCLVSPAGGVAAWLPCHELLATPYSGWQHWFSSLRLRRRLQASPRAAPRLRRPSRGPLHRLLLHGSHAPPGRPRRRRKGYLLIPKPSIGDIVFFKVPTALQNYGVNKDVVFIKRVLATPSPSLITHLI